MKKIILVPIEPIPERYSIDWLNWFERYLKNNGGEYEIIDPRPLTVGITQGSFLDVCGTNYYKAHQLAIISRMIHKGEVDANTTFLFLDAWFPGIEMLAYMRDALGIPFKITGCLHAGSYDPNDFLAKKGMGKWAKWLEESWFKIYDAVFVATQYHKQLVNDYRCVPSRLIKITGFPIFPKEYTVVNKKKIVVFPHRLDEEKQPVLFDNIAAKLERKFPDWAFIKTKKHTKTKEEYYQLLEKSSISVSFARQETWGIAMQESVFAGCLPLVPNTLSYKEMYQECFRYNSFEHALEKLSGMMYAIDKKKEEYKQYHDDLYSLRDSLSWLGNQAIPNMMHQINKL